MPAQTTIEEEFNDGGFIARSNNPLPRFVDTAGSPQASLLGGSSNANRNYKRSYGSKEESNGAATTGVVVQPLRCQTLPSTRKAATERGDFRTPTESTDDEEVNDETANGDVNGGKQQMVTLTGTIKRGRRADDVVHVQLQIPEKELNKLNVSALPGRRRDAELPRTVGRNSGPHVVLFTLLFVPFAFIFSVFATFYVGTMCWYNVYLYVGEERTVWHKIFLCPLLVVAYPVLITVSTLALSVCTAARQVSWRLSRWRDELRDVDKGFFAWLCGVLNVPHCAPYEVVVLNEEPVELSSTELNDVVPPDAAEKECESEEGEENAEISVL